MKCSASQQCRSRAQVVRSSRTLRVQAASAPEAVATVSGKTSDPLMIRTLRGEDVERAPVWMMRQAGRYMKVYQDLCQKHKTFRDRSENVDVSVEVSLQPWRAFKPDGVILFSDILTPLTGMNIPFDIVAGKGPIIADPIRTMEQVKAIHKLDPDAATPYVGETLRILRQEVGNASTVMGFVGAPFTLASYIVEGASSKSFTVIKKMAFNEPAVLHALLATLADNVADYCRYQADNGAQVIQIFDSWASHLAPQDFDIFSGPYIKQIIDSFRSTHPDVPIILYISGSGGLLERMAQCGADIISIDGSVDLNDAISRCGSQFAYQGNMDPGVLFGSHDFITQRVTETCDTARARGVRHIMNLGHGVLPSTPEENVAHFFATARSLRY